MIDILPNASGQRRKRTLFSENGLELGLGSSESTVKTVHSNTQKPIKTESRVEDALFAEETLHTRSGREQASWPWPKACAAMAPVMAPVCGRCFGFLVVSW